MRKHPIPFPLFPHIVFIFLLIVASLSFAEPGKNSPTEASFEVLQGEILYLSRREGDGERYRFVLCFNQKIPLNIR